jgi:hypothetical protein
VSNQAIQEAQNSIGDYKLKTSSDYEVPPHLRVNTTRKRNELLSYRNKISEAKATFNHLVSNMRDKKVLVLKKVRVLPPLF